MNGGMTCAVMCGSLACAVAILAGLSGADSDFMPQVVRGEGGLAVAFGDARDVISRALVHKADSFFHGGVDAKHGHRHAGADPWAWINAHVRAPDVHRHLEGRESVEMMPWFWAAVRADPHNVDAWTSAAYAADRMMKDRALAMRIIAEARANNPDSIEVALMEARMVYDGGKGDVVEAEMLFERAKALGERKCGGRLSELSEREADAYRAVVDYLSWVRGSRGSPLQPSKEIILPADSFPAR